MEDWHNESKKWGNGKVELRRSDEAFRNMVDRMSDKDTPTSLHAYLEDDEDGQEEEGEEEEGSDEEA